MDFEVLGELSDIETIAAGLGIRDLRGGDVRKGSLAQDEGHGAIRLPDGAIRLAELHWYEAHGIGKKELKAKRYFD